MADGWISYPGGAVVEMADGHREHLLYGAEVNFDQLADHAAAGLISQGLVDTELARKPQHVAAQAADKANSEIDRSGVDLSAVPDNYRELDEEEALGVVRAYNRSPKKQGQVLAYEILHSNRQGVVDGGNKKGREQAEKLLAEVQGVPAAEEQPEPEQPVDPQSEPNPPAEAFSDPEPEAESEAEGEQPVEAEEAEFAPSDETPPVEEDGEGDVLEPSGQQEEAS